MDRQKIERSIKGLSEWQRHAQADSDIDANISTAIEALKAQLSQEGTTKGTTSDTISKTETVEHLRRVLEATVPNTDYDEGFIDGIEFGISTVSTMPPVQPEERTEKRMETHACDLISRQAVLKAIDDYERLSAVSQTVRNMTSLREIAQWLPAAQPEPKEGHWIWVAGDLMCSECHTIFTDLCPDYDNSVACPHCGAKMKGADT